MQTDYWRGQLANSQIPSYKNQSVLILNQSSAPCVADKCDSLLPVLQRSLAVKCIQEQSGSRPPDRLSSVPDLILLRPSNSEAAQELIQSCKGKWPHVSILALLCPRWDNRLPDLSSVLTNVDDFLSCPFQDSELLLRVNRLLQTNRATQGSLRATEMLYILIRWWEAVRISSRQLRRFRLWRYRR